LLIFLFEIVCEDNLSREGFLKTRHDVLHTPAVFPVNDLGGDGGHNTPRYWEKNKEMNTAMFNAAILSMNKRGVLGRILEIGIHRYLRFFGVAFVDSGGFIYKRYNLRIKPEKIIEIQEKMGADIASTLDFPINHKVFSENNLIMATVKNAIITESVRKNRDMMLFASVNGYDPLLIRNVIRHLERNCDFDGYALGSLMPKFSNYRLLVDSILAARKEVKNKPLHVYGLGSPLIANLLIYLGVDSFDSAFFVISSGKRNYSVPGYKRIDFSELEKYSKLPCECPVCKTHKIEEIRRKRELLCLHNLSVLHYELNKIKQAIREHRVEDYLSKRFEKNPWAKRAFQYAKNRMRISGG
jgi:7-cyano-7-deazaguanine tRNA-ribosyltransferase